MRKWGRVIVGLVVAGLVAGVVVGRQVRRVGGYWLVSCPANLQWEINPEEAAKIVPEVPARLAIVYLACELKTTQEGVGSGEQPPLAYAQRGKWLGIPLVTIYLDIPTWREYDEAERQRVVGMLVMSQLAKAGGLGQEGVRKVEGEAYYAPGGVAWIAER